MPYEVIPTYSGGSPAQVDEATARRVAFQEKEAYERYVSGFYGEEERERAEIRGLGNIVFSWTARGKEFLVEDIITGEHATRRTPVPREGFDIFAMHVEDAKRGVVVRLPTGERGVLLALARPHVRAVWLVRCESSRAVQEIDIRKTTSDAMLRQKAGQ
jgi:hypothetical protein